MSIGTQDNINIAKLQQTKVLLIDDDRTTRRMVAMAIGDFCDLQQAIDARGALVKIEEFEPRVVFLDIDLPDDNGYNVLKWITRNKPDTHVVMFSGHCDEADIKRANENGARGYVTKPFCPSNMIRHLFDSSALH